MLSSMLRYLLIIIPIWSHSQVCSSPVLLWSNAPLPQSAVSLSTVSPLSLISNHICKLPSEQIQVRLFAVNRLTNEAIQRGEQSKHPILMDAKNEKSQFRYFPAVADDAYKTFSLIPQSNNMQCSHIHFQLTSSTIYETLEDALDAMQVSLTSLGDDLQKTVVMALIEGPVVVQPVSTRVRRQAERREDAIVSDDRSCMFYAHLFYWERFNGTGQSTAKYTLNLDQSSCTPNTIVTPTGNLTSAILQLFWDKAAIGEETVEMTLTANITGRYWYLEKAVVNGSEYRYFAYGMHSKMDTPPTYCYVCTTATFIKYDSKTKYGSYNFTDKLFLASLQFQPFYANGTYFGPPNYCTSFFTSGIWMGITSSLLCLGILLFGVHRMMSIRSNDRFDDPRGKPLFIKAQE